MTEYFKQFWKDDELAHMDNCFFEDAPQVSMGLRMSKECVYAELEEEGDPWGNESPVKQYDLNMKYNDKSEEIIGMRLLPEIIPETVVSFPYIKRIGEVFEGTYEWPPNSGEWLHSSIETPEDLESMLDRVDRLDLDSFMFPDNWEEEKQRIFEEKGKTPEILRHIRGPVTLATSIYGVENLIFLFFDEKDLFRRFSSTILNVILKMSQIMDRESGFNPENRPSGFSFADDDCSLLNPEMYEIFGYPVLKEVFKHYSPNKGDNRYQHSDSAMGHLLPQLAKLNLTGCNFGPTVLVDEIRQYLKHTRIDGCMAPFTFMNNDVAKIKEEVERDCRMIKETGTKGLNIYTAGSINNGSSLLNLKVVMENILEFGRY